MAIYVLRVRSSLALLCTTFTTDYAENGVFTDLIYVGAPDTGKIAIDVMSPIFFGTILRTPEKAPKLLL